MDQTTLRTMFDMYGILEAKPDQWTVKPPPQWTIYVYADLAGASAPYQVVDPTNSRVIGTYDSLIIERDAIWLTKGDKGAKSDLFIAYNRLQAVKIVSPTP